MNVKVEGNPGTGNTYQEFHIHNVEQFNTGNATVTNHFHNDHKQSQPKVTSNDTIQRKSEILQYVGNLKEFVADEWKNRYESIWREILHLSVVSECIFNPGKQKDTTFNRNLVANIIYILCENNIIKENNACTLAKALEGDKDHSVRGQLYNKPDDTRITEAVRALLEK